MKNTIKNQTKTNLDFILTHYAALGGYDIIYVPAAHQDVINILQAMIDELAKTTILSEEDRSVLTPENLEAMYSIKYGDEYLIGILNNYLVTHGYRIVITSIDKKA